MNITHDDTATSWRDLTDQLTPEQVRRFEHFEAMALNAKRDAAPDEHDTADEFLTGLLTEARWEAQQNLTDAMIGLPLPDGAENAGHWDDGGEGNWTHDLQGRRPHGGRVRRGGVTLGDTDAGRCGEVVALRPRRGS